MTLEDYIKEYKLSISLKTTYAKVSFVFAEIPELFPLDKYDWVFTLGNDINDVLNELCRQISGNNWRVLENNEFVQIPRHTVIYNAPVFTAPITAYVYVDEGKLLVQRTV